MTIAEKISLGAAILNGLVFVVMLIALLLQAKTIRHTRKDLQITLLAVRSQALASQIAFMDTQRSRINPQSSLEAQKEIEHSSEIIAQQYRELEALIEKIKTIK